MLFYGALRLKTTNGNIEFNDLNDGELGYLNFLKERGLLSTASVEPVIPQSQRIGLTPFDKQQIESDLAQSDLRDAMDLKHLRDDFEPIYTRSLYHPQRPYAVYYRHRDPKQGNKLVYWPFNYRTGDTKGRTDLFGKYLESLA